MRAPQKRRENSFSESRRRAGVETRRSAPAAAIAKSARLNVSVMRGHN
jgi:hypothetical protein